MKILIFGDIYGRVGRGALKKELPKLKEKYNPDFVVVNIDNISSGRGAVLKHIVEINELGIDVLTSGDHIVDNLKDVKNYLNEENTKLLRPANFYENIAFPFPGKGYSIFEKNGKRLLVIHLLGEVFIGDRVDNPFLKAKKILEELKDKKIDSIIIDLHKEATSELYAMAFYLEGEISLVYGTHTHIQTNDELILPLGTGLIGDVGMTGPLYSIIGADFDVVKKRFLTGINKGKIEQCLDPHYVVNAIIVETDDETKKCLSIEKIRIRGRL